MHISHQDQQILVFKRFTQLDIALNIFLPRNFCLASIFFSQFNLKISNLSIYWLLTFETFVLSFHIHIYPCNDFLGLRYLRGSCKHHNTTLLNISDVSSQNKNIILYNHNTTIKLKKFNIVTTLLFNKQPI